MCCSSARGQRSIVEECLKYVESVSYFPFLQRTQMGDSTDGFWEALDITSRDSLQACRNDSTDGECTKLAGKHHVPDVSYGKRISPLSLSCRILTNGLDLQTTISEARWVGGRYHSLCNCH